MLDRAQLDRSPTLAEDALLIGCGYLGAAMLGGLRGRVGTLTRGAGRHAALTARGVRAFACDLASSDLEARLAPWLRDFRGVVFVLAPPSAWPEDEVEASFARLLAALSHCRVARGVLASSTAVYGDAGGDSVAAGAAVDESSPRSRRLLAIERAWQGAAFDTRVVRLAGLYGPGRVIGLEGIRRGEPVPGDPEAWLNLLHVEDAARATLALGALPGPLPPVLISDGAPLRRRDYYGALAELLGAPAPLFTAEGGRRAGSRRCDPRASWAALGLAPRWPDFRAALVDALAVSGR